ncbi:DUF6098 family protein [Prauserella rugosa]|uniref:Uncharacterized protein n=1 Tax=Prauserella rugosa TaxID=43354 RepID=A0A660CER4_9PSEU|nr:DUF6098 family protein [Prauserella rugosa]KMS91956.1 hypothetical protein ACZ91_06810 [Streptomyces regensis]TWH19999.1 hypothetical protein JD82_01839 [Prauserella rugosa]
MPTVRTLRDVTDLVGRGVAPYLRYSPGPDSDAAHPSTDHESGLLMPGVSINPLEAPGWWTLPLEDWVARRICQYLRELDEGAWPWLLSGRVVDVGPDNEPLLVDVEPVAWMDLALLDEARDHYRSRLEAGVATHQDKAQ